eukprot:1273902-Prymnesium_polylepis.1
MQLQLTRAVRTDRDLVPPVGRLVRNRPAPVDRERFTRAAGAAARQHAHRGVVRLEVHQRDVRPRHARRADAKVKRLPRGATRVEPHDSSWGH